jgi:hypothetical protein
MGLDHGSKGVSWVVANLPRVISLVYIVPNPRHSVSLKREFLLLLRVSANVTRNRMLQSNGLIDLKRALFSNVNPLLLLNSEKYSLRLSARKRQIGRTKSSRNNRLKKTKANQVEARIDNQATIRQRQSQRNGAHLGHLQAGQILAVPQSHLQNRLRRPGGLRLTPVL